MRSIIFFILRLLFFIVLPFIVLIRSSVYLHIEYYLNPWLSVIGGVLASATLLLLYVLYHSYKYTGSFDGVIKVKRAYWLTIALVGVYCAPIILFVAAANTKGEEVQKEYRSLHPVLRLSIGTLIILEKDLIITDANRVPEDYRKMGLPTRSHSLHYKQSSEYVHAVDLRTRGHSWLRNSLVQKYFDLMGFNTLRHIGTDDHLHVSIFSHDRPYGI